MKALLVHEPSDQQHQTLVRLREAGSQPIEVHGGLEVKRIDGVLDHRDPPERSAQDGRDVAAHVPRAGDHSIRGRHHVALDSMNMGLRVTGDPSLVAAELGRVHGHQPGAVDARRKTLRDVRHEPVVRVDQIELEPFAQTHAELVHVRVHPVHPAHECVYVPGKLGLADAVKDHPVADLFGGEVAPAAREDVHLDLFAHEVLGKLAHMPRKATLDDRGILPRDQQHAHSDRGTLSEANAGTDKGALRGAGPSRLSLAPSAGARGLAVGPLE